MEEVGRSGEGAGCVACRQLVLDGPDEQVFLIAPADGGGWHAWSAALLRFIQRIGNGPTQALIVSQEPLTERYVQGLIGHGIAEVQASSNVYLQGESRLTPDHEELLTLLGWAAPALDHDDPDEMPANWSRPRIHGDWLEFVELLVATVVGVFGFDEHVPVTVRTFGCDQPCRACSWPDDLPPTREESQ